MIKHMRWAAVGACATALMIVADGASAAPSWIVVTLTSSPSTVQLSAASMRTTTDGWAVGSQSGLASQTPPPPAAYHWNGTAWSWTSTPSIGFNASLNAVSGSSASDAWAVGGIVQPGYRRRLALYEHWNGSAWSRDMNAPAVGGLNGVVTLSSTNAWAVGVLGVVLHWDGTSWTDVTSSVTQPNPSNIFGNNLTAISASSDSDVWAVGKFTNANYVTQAYALHYVKGAGQATGTWTTMIMDLPSVPAPNSPILHGVVALSPTNVWAVGENEEVPGLGLSTLIEHSNGSTWSIMTSATPGAYPALNAVAARSASDVYAVGFNMPSINGGTQQGMILHWNGSEWSTELSATATGTFSSLYGAAAVAGGREWAVGITTVAGAYQPLALVH